MKKDYSSSEYEEGSEGSYEEDSPPQINEPPIINLDQDAPETEDAPEPPQKK